jgi:hypothetical protein
MIFPDSTGRPRRRRDAERANRLRGRSLALQGVWILNFFLFMVGFQIAFSKGVPIAEGRREQPRVVASYGKYRQLEPPAYFYVVGHEVATGILSVILLPSIVYLEASRRKAGRDIEKVDRGAI